MSFGPGSTLGPFKIQSLIGKGGMGEVFSATDTRLGRQVALKILPSDFAADADRLRRFESEARTLASINHPNILVIHEVGAENGNPYLVSELLEGRTLREELSHGALSVRKAIDYAGQIVNGLAAAHARGIIHRDLKPENIFITNDSRVKILDFGLAKLNPVGRGSCRAESHFSAESSGSAGASPHPNAEASPTIIQSTVPGLVLGTPAYMSPEQVRGETADHRSDIFAFGCVLFEMIAGAPVFRRDTPADCMAAILREEAPDLSATKPNISPAVERVMRRCLEKSPERRFQSASDLAFAIENAGTKSTSILTETVPPTAASWRQAKLLPWALASLCLAVLLFVLSGRRATDSAQRQSSHPIRKFELSLATPGNLARPGGLLYPAISPDGRKIAFANADGLWLRWLDQLAPPVPLARGENIVAPFWSPESTDVAWFDGRNLMRAAITGSRPATIATLSENVNAERIGGAWLTSNRLIFTTGAPALFEVPTHGGKVTTALTAEAGERAFSSATALPAGQGVLFRLSSSRSGSSGQSFAIWTPAGIRKVLLDISKIRLERPAVSPTGHVVFDRWDATRGLWAFPFSLEKLEATGEPRQISDIGYRPSVSNDGTLVCAIGGNQDDAFAVRRLTWVDRSGTVQNRIGPPLPGLIAPSVSPDGLRALAMAGEDIESLDIWLFDLGTGQADRITQNRVQDSIPYWWDGGQSVIFTHYSTGGVQVLRKPAQAIGSEEVLAKNMGYCWTVSAMTRSLVGNVRNRWGYVSLADTNHTFILFPEVLRGIGSPALSPDGKSLAYRSADVGPGEIYVLDFPQFTNLRQISRAGGFNPQWHPDSSEVFFFSSDGRSLMAARKNAGSSDFDASAKLFDLPPSINPGGLGFPNVYTVSPDGARFLMLENAQPYPSGAAGSAPNAMVIENWSEAFNK